MKINKKLQNVADDSLEAYHDDKVAERLKAEIKAQAGEKESACKRSRRIKAAIFSSVSAFAAALVIMLCVFLPAGTPTDESRYGTSEHTEFADISAMNAALSYCEINADWGNYAVTVVSDSKTGDEYYYVADIHGSGERMRITALIDAKYPRPFGISGDEIKRQAVGKYTVTYTVRYEESETGATYADVYGELLTAKERLYFTYHGKAEGQSTGFADCVLASVREKA